MPLWLSTGIYMKEVKKKWGHEKIIINCKEYCGKLLYIDKGAQCSLHMHPVKKETFYVLRGLVDISIDGKRYIVVSHDRPKTILPGTYHQFMGITDAVILEISTHHEDDDCIRKSESRSSNG